MKDYRLSEVQAICEKRKHRNASCIGCEMEQFCFALNPACVDIEPRDMIELPYKQALGTVFSAYKWEVFFRLKDGVIGSKLFDTEPEADAFLAKLKGGK